MARIDNGHNGFVIAPKLNTLPCEMREPDCACHHYGETFLPFDAYTPQPCLAAGEGAIYPGTIAH